MKDVVVCEVGAYGASIPVINYGEQTLLIYWVTPALLVKTFHCVLQEQNKTSEIKVIRGLR